MNSYSLIWLMLAGIFNGIMDSIVHHPWVWKFLGNNRFHDWVIGTWKITGDWMIGPLYALKDGWHCAKIFMWLCVNLAIVSNIKGTWTYKLIAFIVLALVQWLGFLLIYKGILA